MIYFSALLPVLYPTDAEALFAALAAHDVPYALLDGTRDVWLRDFMPVFGIEQDAEAETSARQLFSKEIVPVNIREIARQGGCLNCISWEGPHA